MHTLRKLIRHKKTPDPDIFHTGESLVPVRRSVDEGHRHLLPNGEALPLPGEPPKVTVIPRSPPVEDVPVSSSDPLRLQYPEPALAPTSHARLGTAALGGSSRRSQDLDHVPRGMMPSSADYHGGLLSGNPDPAQPHSHHGIRDLPTVGASPALGGHTLRRSRDFDNLPAEIARSSGEYNVGFFAKDPEPTYTFGRPTSYDPTAVGGGAALASHSLRRSQDLGRPPPGALLSADYHAGPLPKDPLGDPLISPAPSSNVPATKSSVWLPGA